VAETVISEGHGLQDILLNNIERLNSFVMHDFVFCSLLLLFVRALWYSLFGCCIGNSFQISSGSGAGLLVGSSAPQMSGVVCVSFGGSERCKWCQFGFWI